MRKLSGWMRVALVDLRGDLRRFGMLLACLALGTGTIAGVSSVGAALQQAIVREANILLGGDIEAFRADRRASEAERAYFESLGQVAETLDSNARADAFGGATAFLDVLAVSPNYPLVGAVASPQLTAGEKPAPLLARRDGVPGALVDPLLLDRLQIGIGDRFVVNGVAFEARGLLHGLPDGAVRGFHLGLTVLVDIDAYAAAAGGRTPLPGLLTQHRYKVVLDDGDYQMALPKVAARLVDDPLWKVRSPYEAAGTLARFYDFFVRFLLIVGLSSLLVGGVGISNAVSAYIDERRRAIATLMSLGATGRRIMVHFLTQIGVLSFVGIAIGLVIGAGLTVLALPLLGGILNVTLPPSVDGASLLSAAAFGLVASFGFSYLPLARASRVKPAILFRAVGDIGAGAKASDILRASVLVPLLGAGFGLFALALWTTQNFALVAYYALGVAAAFGFLRGAGWLLQSGLRRLSAPRNAVLRHALRGIHRPGSPAPVVIMSLGLGLAMLLVIVILSGNLRNQLLGEVRDDAPSFVATDLFDDELQELGTFLADTGIVASHAHSPMIRAAVTKLNGVPSDAVATIGEEAEFMLSGEIPMTWAADLPAESRVTAGAWWPEGYAGPPLVSLRARTQETLGLKVGDRLELTLFGESIEATVANFREFSYRDGLNFLVTASPDTFAEFPGTNLVTIKAKPGREKTLERLLASRYPDLTFIPVGDALNKAAEILGRLSTAVGIIGGLALANGLLVLAGTMAAGRTRREADAVIHKVLGATRLRVIRVFALEYALLGAFAALLATAVGIVGTLAIMRQANVDVGFSIDPLVIAGVVVGAVVLTIFTGGVTTWSALSSRPARFLRASG